MLDTTKQRIVIAILERLHRKFPWVKLMYLVEGSPMQPKRYRALPIDAGQFKGFALADFRGNEGKDPEFNTGVFWLESLRQLDAKRSEAKVWIILQTPKGDPPKSQYDGRRLFAGQLTITEREGKLSVSSLDTLTKEGGRLLVPPEARRVGCSPLVYPTTFTEDAWIWLKNDDVLATQIAMKGHLGNEAAYGISVHRLKLRKDTFKEVRATIVNVERFVYGFHRRISFSPDGRYFVFPEGAIDKSFQHAYRADSNRRLYLIQGLPRQGYFDIVWINNTEWVQYKNQDRRLVVEKFSIRTGKQVDSRSYLGLLDEDSDALAHIGITAKGELAFRHREMVEGNPLKIVLIPLKEGKPTVIKIPLPTPDNPDFVKLSPDGRWLLWYVPQDSDRWFFRNSIWVTRADGSGKRHLADVIQPLTGFTEDFPARPKWRRDSRSIGAVWENCLYAFDI